MLGEKELRAVGKGTSSLLHTSVRMGLEGVAAGWNGV